VIRAKGGGSTPGSESTGIYIEISTIVTGGNGSITLEGTGAVSQYSNRISEGISLKGSFIKSKAGNIALEGFNGTTHRYGITVGQGAISDPDDFMAQPTIVNPFIGTSGAVSISGDSLVVAGANLEIYSGHASQITAPVISIFSQDYGLTKTGPGILTFSGDASVLTDPGASYVVTRTGIFSDANNTTAFSGVTRAQALYAFVAPAQTSVYLRLNTGLSSVYGDTPAFPYSLYNASSGGTAITDALPSGTALWTGGPTATSNVGSYNLTYSSGITLGSSSYLLNTGGAVSYAITPRPITLTADAKTKVYGETDPALTYQITTGNLSGDDVLSGALSRTPGDTAGVYTISTLGLQESESNSNYAITGVDGLLTITQAAQSSVPVMSAVNNVYIVPPIVSRPAAAQLNVGLQLVDASPAETAQSDQTQASGAVSFDPVAAAKRAPGTVLVLTGGVKRAADDKDGNASKKAGSKR
jgi:hypothetical protein